MAKSRAVWGIDLGQCALRAIRCTSTEDGSSINAVAFDYIEYPKVLSQPDADAAELVSDALKQFLSRNEVKGDTVCVSVAGQAGLARFIKLPPVESKKIPDIVKYEARQQIPFPLEEVVWDYQQMSGGAEEEGFALETEVGLFAMKRDQVFKSLKPFEDAGIEVHTVQLTPLALYNFVAYDQMPNLPPPDEYDPDDPPDSIVILSMGCDTTDLVVTNGFRVWQRSIPIGGNHFTRSLMKELDLPFGKAEHLKRNATQAEDPKAVFQAMRPVFNDLVTECQRSIQYFQNLDRNAKLKKIVGMGGVMKLPGIRTYLTQNLGFDVERLETFHRLGGPAVTESPTFKEHILSFGPCYGLVLQGLTDTKINTNLIPPEIVQDRMIRDKKPWAVAAAASLLLGLAISGVGDYWRAWNAVHADPFKPAETEHQQNKAKADQLKGAFETELTAYNNYVREAEHLTQNTEARLQWLELLKAINVCLPPYPELQQPQPDPKASQAEQITKRHQIHITRVESEEIQDLSQWYQLAKQAKLLNEKEKGDQAAPNAGAANQGPLGPSPQPGVGQPGAGPGGAVQGPAGKGWMIRLTGYHYHNLTTPDGAAIPAESGMEYVRATLLAKLAQEEVLYISAEGKQNVQDIGDMGIMYPVILANTPVDKYDPLVDGARNPFGGDGMMVASAGGPGGYPGAPAGVMREDGGGRRPRRPPPGYEDYPGPAGSQRGNNGEGQTVGTPALKVEEQAKLPLRRIDFQVAFIWQPRTTKQRLEIDELRRKAREEEERRQAALNGELPPGAGPLPGGPAPVTAPPTGVPPGGTPAPGVVPPATPGSRPPVAPPQPGAGNTSAAAGKVDGADLSGNLSPKGGTQ